MSLFSGAFCAKGQIATFENFPEGPLGSWFVDPISGIIFTNPIESSAPSTFSVDYGLTAPISPNHFLLGPNYSPGLGIGFTFGFGFTFILPTPATSVQMDEIYGSLLDSSLQVRGYSINGTQVLNTNILLPVTGLGKTVVLHSVVGPVAPISKVVVTLPNGSAGFDNIGVPPLGAPPLIQSILATNQTLFLRVTNARAQSQLWVSTNFTIWSTISAEVTNDSGSMIFSVPILGANAFYRVLQ